jgi:hypothetical protein
MRGAARMSDTGWGRKVSDTGRGEKCLTPVGGRKVSVTDDKQEGGKFSFFQALRKAGELNRRLPVFGAFGSAGDEIR